MAGDVIAGRYRLLEPLGGGAMSAVWLAQDDELGRRVAVKVLGPTADRARFDREARAVAALSHPHICQLYDYGEDDGRPFMVLEYLSGGSLEDRLREDRPLDDAETQRIAAEIASGLAHAHERGLVHRDLKPANVLFDSEDRAKIADFGIARMGGGGTLTEAGTVLGTASYISPEQAAGEPATAASDVYSFGVILFRMLTGRLPFQSRNAMELVRLHRDEPAPPVSEARPDTPPRLEALTTACLAKVPTARPADGRALLRELQGSDDATVVLAPELGSTQSLAATQIVPPPLRKGRRRLVAIAIAAAILVAGIAAAVILAGGDDNDAPPATSSSGLTLPTVPPGATSTAPTTTAPTTTEETTTAESTQSTTAETTTAPTTTTAPPTTTAPATTTAPPTTAPPTTAPTTTAPTTTAPATTTVATTTAPEETTIATTTAPDTTIATTVTTTVPGG